VDSGSRIWTVGHSNHPLERFVGILKAHGIRRILDVRRFPVSRKWPHFDAESLAASLAAEGIEYVGMPELGGRRIVAGSDGHRADWFAYRLVDAYRMIEDAGFAELAFRRGGPPEAVPLRVAPASA